MLVKPIARRGVVTIESGMPPEVFRFIKWCPGFTKWVSDGTGVIFDASRIHIDEWNKRHPQWPIEDADGSVAKLYMSVAEVKPHKRLTIPRSDPWQHQVRAVDIGMSREFFGFFHDMGTGKTREFIEIAAERFAAGEIDQLFVVTVNKAQTQIRDEQLPEHMPSSIRYRADLIPSKRATKLFQYPNGALIIGIASPGAFQSKRQSAEIRDFCKAKRTMWVIDESQNFKGWSSERVKNARPLVDVTVCRFLFSGEPAPLGYIDLFSQFYIMDPNILGHNTLGSFKKAHCIMGGYETKEIVDYKNITELSEAIAPHCEYVKITDCLDMPERTWEDLKYTMTPQQKELYARMRHEFIAEAERANNEGNIEVVRRICKNAASKFTALQQIASGFFYENPDDDGNKGEMYHITDDRAEFSIERIYGSSKKCIIWARFHEDLASLQRVIEKYKIDAVEFSGRISHKQCNINKIRFQTDETCKLFYGTASMGGTALNLQVAHRMGFHSHTWNWNDRNQAERRTWRGGQRNHCWYGDVIGCHVDRSIQANAQKKEDMSETLQNVTKLARMALALKDEQL